jgi:hypothetical protein
LHPKKQLKERNTMRAALHLRTTILPGGKIEIADDALPSGEAAEVIVLFPAQRAGARRSAVDILAEAPGQRLFKTPADVERYLREERSAWDR